MISRQRQTATKRACPPVMEDNCISPTDSCGRHTDTQAHHWWGCNFFFPLSILVFVLAKLPCISQGRLLGAFLFQLYLFCFGCQLCLSVAVFIITRIGGCEGGVTTSPSVSHDVLCRSFPSLVSFRLPSFVSVSFSNNNCWIKLSGNFRGTLCYGRPSC